MTNRKNILKFTEKLHRKESQNLGNKCGTLYSKWQDTEEMLLTCKTVMAQKSQLQLNLLQQKSGAKRIKETFSQNSLML